MSGRAGPAALRLAAPAKLNLYLRVLGRRDDGYHLIDSLIAFAAECDVVTVAPAEAISLRIDGPFAAALTGGKDNLVSRAAHALADTAAVRHGAAISLTKNLPVAAGIGGGSADAAATLRLLDRLWRLDFGADGLSPIALSLGADVPACLDGRVLRAGGIGEVIEPAPPLPPVAVVLVNSGRPVETAAVFRARTGAFSEPAPASAHFGNAASAARWLGALGNDLLVPARRMEPSIADALAALAAEDGCLSAHLSGTGATCFALFEKPDAATAAAFRLSEKHSGWWIRASQFRDRPAAIEEVDH